MPPFARTPPRVLSCAPGLVHGGVVATLLDEVLGHAAISTDVSLVTATLNVRYHASTPGDRFATVMASVPP